MTGGDASRFAPGTLRAEARKRTVAAWKDAKSATWDGGIFAKPLAITTLRHNRKFPILLSVSLSSLKPQWRLASSNN